MTDDATWHYGYLSRPEADDPSDVVLNVGEPVPPADAARIKRALGFVQMHTRYHPLNTLQAAFGDLLEEFQEWPYQRNRDIQTLQRVVSEWLSHFRAFSDQYAHTLSDRFGKESPERAAFEQACSWEYDNTFAYRFCYKLRNYAQHARWPLQHVNSSETDDGERQLTATFDVGILLRGYDGWGAVVRADLTTLPPTFDALPVLEAATVSCETIVARTILAMRRHFEDARDVLAEAISHVPDDDNLPILVTLPPENEITQLDRSQITMSEIHRMYPSHLDGMIAQALAHPRLLQG